MTGGGQGVIAVIVEVVAVIEEVVAVVTEVDLIADLVQEAGQGEF